MSEQNDLAERSRRDALARAAQNHGKLLIQLEGTVEGIAVNQPKKNIGHYNYFDYDERRYPNGILFAPKRKGEQVTVVPARYGSTVDINRGKVSFEEGFTFVADSRNRTLFWTSSIGGPDVELVCTGSRFIVEPDQASKPKWGLMFHNTQDIMLGCTVDSETVEHARYGHGYAASGAPVWSECEVENAGAECFKQANRPEEGCRWYPDQTLLIDNCVFRGWESHTYSGGGSMGGGIVLQGTGAHAKITNCALYGPSHVATNAIMVDDGYGDRSHHESRFFDTRSGVPQPKFFPQAGSSANGYIVIEDTAIIGWGKYFVPMVRVGTMGSSQKSVDWYTALGFMLNRCGVYGESTKVEISNVAPLPSGRPAVVVDGCNTPEIRNLVAKLAGSEALFESVIGYGAEDIWHPVSQGFLPMRWAPEVVGHG